MHFAAGSFYEEKPDIVQLLLDNGAESDAADNDGRLPTDIAKQKDYGQTAKPLTVKDDAC